MPRHGQAFKYGDCGKWTFNWRIIANGYKCGHCHQPFDIWRKSDRDRQRPPWVEDRPKPTAPLAILDQLPPELRNGAAATALIREIGDTEAAKKFAAY